VFGLIAALLVEKPLETLATKVIDPSQSASSAAPGPDRSSLPGFEPLAPQEGQAGLTVPVIAPMDDGPSNNDSESKVPVLPE
jgi:hypothetical protein